MAVSMIGPKFYAWDRCGKPLAFGKLYTYQARTNTPKPTYQSEDQVVPNTNPVILNGEGYANVYLSGSYKMVLKDKDDNEIWTSDPVSESGGNGFTYTLTALYKTSNTVTVSGDHYTAFPEGAAVVLEFNDTGGDEVATVLSSRKAGNDTEISFTEPVVRVGVVRVSVANGFSVVSGYQEALNKYTLRNVGDYSQNPQINEYYEFVSYNNSPYFAVTIPYQIDNTTYPTPDLDPNLKLGYASNESLVTADNTPQARKLSERFNDTSNVFDFGAKGDDIIDDFQSIQLAFDSKSEVKVGNGNSIFKISEALKFNTLCNIDGGGAGVTTATTGGVPFVVNAIKKTTNNEVTITNPELPDVTVDCLMYSNGDWGGSQPFPQNMTLENIGLLSAASEESDVGIYLIQGGGWNFNNLNIQDVTNAIETDSVWRATFNKIQTNGIFKMKSGTSNHFKDCTAGSSRLVDGVWKSGGWDLKNIIYSTLIGCTSDGGKDTAYKFADCQGVSMIGCGAEFQEPEDQSGETPSAIDFYEPCRGFKVIGCTFVPTPSLVVPLIRVYYNCDISIEDCVLSLKQAETQDNIDFYIAGSNSRLYVKNTRFSDGSFTEPKIVWDQTVQNNSSSVYVEYDGKVRRYYTKNDGKTYVELLFDQVGSNADGAYELRQDGQAHIWKDLDKNDFQGIDSTYTIQGLTYYRSIKNVWTFPVQLSGAPYVTLRGEKNTSTGPDNAAYALAVTASGLGGSQSGQLYFESLDDTTTLPFDRVSVEAFGSWVNESEASKSQ